MKELTFEDAIPFIERIPDQEKLTLVGGQALCFWVEFYSVKYKGLIDDNWLISTQDIDFLGDQQAVRECAKAWHADVELSSIDDSSPNSGIALIDFDGEKLRIDFLWNVQGLDKSDIEKERFEMMIPTSTGNTAFFYILSPILCLVSRISNVLTLHRTDQHSLDQLKAAISVVKCYIYELLGAENEKGARQVIEFINKISKSSDEGIRLYLDFDIDIFDAVPQDARFHSRFNGERLPRMKSALLKKRERLKRSRAVRASQQKD